MKISIITPTNNPQFLDELYGCIAAQTHKDWEWVVLLNQGAKYEREKGRGGEGEIKIIECPFVNDSVGLLKRLACMNVTGEVTVEVDHDDLITPDCLEKIAKAFEDPEVGFVYSRNAKLTDRQILYDPAYGWTADYFWWKGKKLYAPFNQPLLPGRLGHIYFAPDHVRAWRTSVYESIGGHDDTLKVCDDLDLMHRMYLATKFKEIPEVLYIYRINGNNTYIQRKEQVRKLSEDLYAKNVEGLARRYSELNNLLVVEGPPSPLRGAFPPEGGKDPLALGEYGDNSVGLVIAKDVMQYVEDKRGFMEEVHRVLAPGGMLISETPSTDGRGAFMDPEVKSMWNENSFWYFTKANWAKRIGNGKLFRECRLATVFRDEFAKEHRMAHVVAHLEKI